MSDNDHSGKAGAWTETAKYEFLLRVVAQLREDGKSINWQKLEMPGRTTKSLQNMWTKINKECAALGEGEGGVSTPKTTPRKRQRKAHPDGGDENSSPTKRRTPKTPKSAQKVSKSDDDSDNVVSKAEEAEI